MDELYAAERILRLLCGRARAAEMTGDLLEQGDASPRVLWGLVLRVGFAASWRWVAAVAVVIPTSVLLLMKYMQWAMFTRSLPATSPSVQDMLHLVNAANCVWCASVLNASRRGFRNRFTVTGLSLTAMVLVMAYLSVSVPMGTLIGSCAVLLALLCFSVRALPAALLTMTVTSVAYGFAFHVFQGWIHMTRTTSARVLGFQLVGYWLLSFAVAGFVLGRMHALSDRVALSTN